MFHILLYLQFIEHRIENPEVILNAANNREFLNKNRLQPNIGYLHNIPDHILNQINGL